MVQMKNEEAQSLLQKLRQIRQASGEALSLVEHSMQLSRGDESLGFSCYNPDEYLEAAAKREWSPPNGLDFESKGDDLR